MKRRPASSGASQPASSIVASEVWARVRELGRFPRRLADPATETEIAENALWQYLYRQKPRISEQNWDELRSYGAVQLVDVQQLALDQVTEFVRERGRLPQSSKTDINRKEHVLALVFKRQKKKFDSTQSMQFEKLEKHCEELQQQSYRSRAEKLIKDIPPPVERLFMVTPPRSRRPQALFFRIPHFSNRI